MPARPAASPPAAHQVKISNSGSAAAGAADSSVAAVSSDALSLDEEQPAARSAIAKRPARNLSVLLRIHIPFSATQNPRREWNMDA